MRLLTCRCIRGGLPPIALLLSLTACSSRTGTPSAPSPTPEPGAPIFYTAIGASDAAGIGSTVPCLPFTTCAEGTGYVPIVARDLARDGATVTLMNMGIPAAVLSPRIQAIGAAYGRSAPASFLNEEAPFVPKNTTHLTIFAGGNDTNTIAAAAGGGAGGSDPDGYIDAQIRAFGDDYASLLRIIRQRAPVARIAAANLPNFAGMPFTAAFSPRDKLILQRISVGFSTQVFNPLVSQGVAVVDLLCDPRFADPGIYSADGFHPNNAGHRYLAEQMLNALTQAGYPPPQSSCARMTLVPAR
ncbi:MAG: SGNH/GDSL hydrolase family protein [Acidobacteria bacterium]|nr:SGNH/GDSL hydrolase family protein [Acidobacteriota bacterium]